MYFDPPKSQGGGWKLTKFKLDATETHHKFDVSGFWLTYEAKVHAICEPRPYHTVSGTRIKTVYVEYPTVAWDKAGLGGDVPIPHAEDFLNFVLEGGAHIVLEHVHFPMYFSHGDGPNIKIAITANRPKLPTDGEWKGTSPCK